jgi:hypothetical protein
MMVTSYPERCFLRRSSYFAAAAVSPPLPFRRRSRGSAPRRVLWHIRGALTTDPAGEMGDAGLEPATFAL